jgi:hypothetical protein
MAISLYEASVGMFIQTLGAMEGVLKRGLAHIEDNNIDPKDVVETRLFPDMLPFRYQVQAAVGHSVAAIEGCKAGVYKPPYGDAKADYPALQKTVADAVAALQAISPAEVDALQGRDVVFELGDRKMPFLAEGFLLSFSVPNFHFHATTAYDILRSRGVPLGKRDYLGRLRLKM